MFFLSILHVAPTSNIKYLLFSYQYKRFVNIFSQFVFLQDDQNNIFLRGPEVHVLDALRVLQSNTLISKMSSYKNRISITSNLQNESYLIVISTSVRRMNQPSRLTKTTDITKRRKIIQQLLDLHSIYEIFPHILQYNRHLFPYIVLSKDAMDYRR